MIRAIIFDCFGVLTTDGWKALREEYCTTDELLQRAHDLDVAVNSGFIRNDEFVSGVAELCGLTRKDVEQKFSVRHTNTALFSFITSELAPTYKIGMLSNAAHNMLNTLFTPEQTALFDAVTLSCELGLVKPNPKMYETIVAKLGIEPEECIFIDDIERYCTGARDVGMHAVHYTNLEQCKRDITNLLQ